jgi:hypothetical protein
MAIDWKALYEDSMLEVDETKIRQKIEAAENAMRDRLEDALHGRLPIDAAERQAIEDARYALSSLKKTLT